MSAGNWTRKRSEAFLPSTERQIKERAKIQILLACAALMLVMSQSRSKKIKFDFRHFNDIERLAIIGETMRE